MDVDFHYDTEPDVRQFSKSAVVLQMTSTYLNRTSGYYIDWDSDFKIHGT